MKNPLPFSFAAVAAGLLVTSPGFAAVIAENDFTGDTVPNLAYMQAGRDSVDSSRPIGLGHVVQEDGVMKFPVDDEAFYFTAARGLVELPEEYSVEMVFEYKDVTTGNCSFGISFNDFGSEQGLSNFAVRMGLDITGSGAGWQLITGRREAGWPAVGGSPFNFAQPAVVDDPMTLSIVKTGPATIDVTLTSTANGVLVSETGVDLSSLGVQSEFGQPVIFNAAFGGETRNPVWVDSIEVLDSGSEVIFADGFESAEIDRARWLINELAPPFASWPESFPNRPTVVDGNLRLRGVDPFAAVYARGVLNTDTRVDDFVFEAVIDVVNGDKADTNQAGFFGVKVRNIGDEGTSIVCGINPETNTAFVGDNIGFNGFENEVSESYTVGTGDTVHIRITASGNTVTMELAPDEIAAPTVVTKSDVSGDRLNPGTIHFFNLNLDTIDVVQFTLSDPAVTSVENWNLF